MIEAENRGSRADAAERAIYGTSTRQRMVRPNCPHVFVTPHGEAT